MPTSSSCARCGTGRRAGSRAIAALAMAALALVPGAPRGDEGLPARAVRMLPGLAAPATVTTDRWGIPHVRAGSVDDLYLTWGYVTGRDRLWQLALTRAEGEGLTHRWLGNGRLQADGGAQLFQLRERAAAIWARDRRDPVLRRAVERYSAGINAAMAERFSRPGSAGIHDEFARLGVRPDPWRPEDSVLLELGLGATLDLELPELAEARALREHGAAWLEHRGRFEGEFEFATIRAPGAPDAAARAPLGAEAAPATVPASTLALAGAAARLYPAREQAGADRASNEFAVGPRRGARGRPLLANDPHLALESPGPFHVVHLVVPGIVNAIGAAVPGLPAIVSGRNDRCAWGVTALSADVIDLYADTLSADSRNVKTPRGWVPVATRPFDLRYRVLGIGLPVPAFMQQRRYTPHGPVIAWDSGRHLALTARWSALEDRRVTLARLVGLERSASAEEVAARFRTLVTPTINALAADVDGAVIYQASGLVPRRPFPFTRGVLPSDGRHEWAGFVPADSMPAWRVPPGSFAVNGNNLPQAGLDWARYDWAHDRAARMAQRLGGDASVTLADAASIQNDVYSRASARQLPALLACADSLRGHWSLRERAALDTMRAWNCFARRDRVAPTLVRSWWNALQRRSRTEGYPGLALAGLQGRAPDAFRKPGSEAAERPAEAALAALAMALDTLSAKLGPDMHHWAWGRAHAARFAHPLTGMFHERGWEHAPLPIDGDGSTVCVGGSRAPFDLIVTHGPAYRHVVDLAIADSSLGVVPPWNSATVRADLAARWAAHGYVPFLRDPARIAAEAAQQTTLLPRAFSSR